MEMIWVCWFIFGLVSGLILYALDEREHYRNRDRDPDVPDAPRELDGVDRNIPSSEEIEKVLHYFAIGASHREQEVINYLIEEHGGEEE